MTTSLTVGDEKIQILAYRPEKIISDNIRVLSAFRQLYPGEPFRDSLAKDIISLVSSCEVDSGLLMGYLSDFYMDPEKAKHSLRAYLETSLDLRCVFRYIIGLKGS
ncbi:hypothetical protein KDA11_01945 [Candidatus Saccharibacteria bacterium]|nr:hypothetical protein [Candidatus Saccharibacteria bacterium]